ncbi:MAG: ABC1 kinase family protein [Halobacteria archaeon]
MARAYWRFVQAVVKFLPLIWAFARDRKRYILFGPSRKMSYEAHQLRARQLTDILLNLGPTYIKLGQLLSTRPDLMPQAYIDELIELQDDVPPAPWEEVKPIIEEDIGDPDVIFDDFEKRPISGASLGQVHLARYHGEKLAVKVRRPGVESLVTADLTVVKTILPWIQGFMKKFGEEAHAQSMKGLAEDFELRINQEMDYNRERTMLNEIQENLEGDDRVKIPSSYSEISSKRVLSLEYVSGIKINDVQKLKAEGHDTKQLAKDLEKIYLQMALIDGVFHGDPHPGNLAVNEKGQIVIYDFGMSGRLSPSLQESFVEFYMAASSHDEDGVIDAMIDMGALDRDVDRELMREVIGIAIEDLSGEKVDDMRIEQLIDEVEETVYEYPLRIPQHIALGLRVSTIVEGVCIELDPDFDFLAVAKEFFIEQGYVQKQVRGKMRNAWDDVKETVSSIANTPTKLESSLDKIQRNEVEVVMDVEDTHEHIEKLGKRVSYALIAGSFILGGAVMARTYQNYALVMFLFGLLLFYLVRRSFKKKKGGVMGPTTYATRTQAESTQEKYEDKVEDQETEEHIRETEFEMKAG